MLSLLIKTFEQILKNGEQIQNVENFFINVVTLDIVNMLDKFSINSYMFE